MDELVVVPRLGGGLNLSELPRDIQPDQWSWSNAMRPHDGVAEVMHAFTQVLAAGWLTLTPRAFQPYLVDDDDDKVAVLAANPATEGTNAKLYTIDSGGSVANLSITGAAPAFNLSFGEKQARPNTAVIAATGESRQFFSGSVPSSVTSKFTMVRTNTFGIDIVRVTGGLTELTPAFVANAAGALMVGWVGAGVGQGRRILVSDAGNGDEFRVNASTTSDDTIFDAHGPIEDMVSTARGAAIVCRDAIYMATATGGVPAFRFDREAIGAGALWASDTPLGLIYYGGHGLYLLNGPRVDGMLGNHLVRSGLGQGDFTRISWHAEYAALAMYDYAAQVLWYVGPNGAFRMAHGFSMPYVAGVAITRVPFRARNTTWLFNDSTDQIIADATRTTPFAGAFLETKDFAFGLPSENDRTISISVDWEPMSNATTDAIVVKASVRNDFSSGILGRDGMQTDQLSFTTLGTLAANGSHELANLNLRGKYVRFRFEQSSGFARIRGFTIRRRRGSDIAA